MVFLLKLVHGNSTSVRQMIVEFKTYWCEYVKINKLENVRTNISKKQLIKKIQNIASKGNNQQLGKLCYTVNTEILEKYDVPDLELASGLVYPVPKENGDTSSLKVSNSIGENGSSTGENVKHRSENGNSTGENKTEQCIVQKPGNKEEPMEVE